MGQLSPETVQIALEAILFNLIAGEIAIAMQVVMKGVDISGGYRPMRSGNAAPAVEAMVLIASRLIPTEIHTNELSPRQQAKGTTSNASTLRFDYLPNGHLYSNHIIFNFTTNTPSKYGLNEQPSKQNIIALEKIDLSNYNACNNYIY